MRGGQGALPRQPRQPPAAEVDPARDHVRGPIDAPVTVVEYGDFEWSGPPAGTRSLALIVDDPDAPVGTFTHWLGWGIDPGSRGPAAGEPAPVEGRNDFRTTGYRGPCPPRGHGPHRYVFRLFALDAALELRPGKDRADVERAANAHNLAVAELVGVYER
jgi:Raf kinase inhibitor-like YbhB/YbcL family protein